jgi:hypothetical protein
MIGVANPPGTHRGRSPGSAGVAVVGENRERDRHRRKQRGDLLHRAGADAELRRDLVACKARVSWPALARAKPQWATSRDGASPARR